MQSGGLAASSWDAHSPVSSFSDIQDRSIIKIYRKEPLYASFPASHIANGDLRVRGGQGVMGGGAPGRLGWMEMEGWESPAFVEGVMTAIHLARFQRYYFKRMDVWGLTAGKSPR